ncbi:Tat pathway signal protein, partial [Vibrio parahaemolyticus]
MDISRRNFLKSTASFGAIASLGLPGYSLAAPSNDFRALICVYLAGGNDAINTILPLSDFHYNQYANVRGSLSVAKNTIIPIGLNAHDANNNAVPLGLHPKLSALAPLFQQSDANLVLNSGILNQPVTKQAIEQGDVPLPEQLFSHNSQTASWLRGGMDASTNLGWAGRMLDVLTSDAQITPLYSVHGDTLWLKAMEHRQTVLKKDKAVQLTAVGNPLYEEIYQKLLSQSADNPFSGHFNLMVDESMMMSNILAEQLKLIDDAPLFSSSTLGKQMQTVYKLIASQSALSQQRQVF